MTIVSVTPCALRLKDKELQRLVIDLKTLFQCVQAVFNLAMSTFPIITIPLPKTMHNNIRVENIQPMCRYRGVQGEPIPSFENSEVLNLHSKITENMP